MEGSIWRIDGQDQGIPTRIFIQPAATSRALHLMCLFEFKQSSDSNCDEATFTSTKFRSTILRVLENWATRMSSTTTSLTDLTIGSRLMVSGQPDGACSNMNVYLSPNFELQRRYLSLDNLAAIWGGRVDIPPCTEFDQLISLYRLDENVSVVSSENTLWQGPAIFKGCTKGIARMYHEIRLLLQLPPHANIVSKPIFLVTRAERGCDKPIVCGYIIPYFDGGTLEALINRTSWAEISQRQRLKWSRQILSALRHILERGHTYYSELKPDNILLSHGGEMVLTDFEQSGNWAHWFPPPIAEPPFHSPGYYPHRSFATVVEENEEVIAWHESSINPSKMVAGIHYSNRAAGYWKDFGLSSAYQQENYMVYLFAKILWCIFEWQTHRDSRLWKVGIGSSEADGPGADKKNGLFPAFVGQRTPQQIQHWIWLATRDSPGWEDKQCNCAIVQMEWEICGDSGAAFAVSQSPENIIGISRPSLEQLEKVLESIECETK
ncbi:hypothetical protein FE257_004445 [Aspergillus nanangensis]|uniref:Protein kinase domain-containing protein n=1 Tax=Aspergillus nanangensis TaxID=2582783 RepID=A0AAD4GYE3_ASPNN|nr:hypothetical protein FE257_004445 [Aspergillus nanangensis]